MRHLYIMMLAAAALAAAEDPRGWSKARWGMSDDEILRAFDGQAKRLETPDPYQHARVGIPSLEVAGVHFKVYFSPGTEDRLDHILFEPLSQEDNTDATFQSLETLLVQKYGRPWKSDEGSSAEIQWTFQSTVITLSRTVLPRVQGMPRTVTVSLVFARRTENPL